MKGFGTWRQQEGFDRSFSGLIVPKEPKRLVDVLTDDEIDHILKSIDPHTPTGSRLYGVAVFRLDSRLRISEVVNARLPDVNLEPRQIWITGKGDKQRIVPSGTRTGRGFLNYLHLHRPTLLVPNNDQPFLSMDCLPLTRHPVERTLARLKRTSGVERLRRSLFRHTFAIKYLMNGGDLLTLQRLLGHESLEITERCPSLSRAQVQLRYDSYSPMDRIPRSRLRRSGNISEIAGTSGWPSVA